MKRNLPVPAIMALLLLFFTACKKESGATQPPPAETGIVSGKVTDSRGNPLPGVKITIEHTVWSATYVFATTDANGNYSAALPAEPAGSWTAKGQLVRSAYGQSYTFDLAPSSADAFNRQEPVTRNFTWKLSGPRSAPGTYFGAHVDLYQFGTAVSMTRVKLVFTPYPGENTAIDGSPLVAFERNVEDVAGTFMANDIPIGKYLVKAVYPGKTLLLDNRHDEGNPEVTKPVVFGKNGYLAQTAYNTEFWLSE